jgi:hypothetical protein
MQAVVLVCVRHLTVWRCAGHSVVEALAALQHGEASKILHRPERERHGPVVLAYAAAGGLLAVTQLAQLSPSWHSCVWC